MGILDTIKNVADGADAVKKIHDTGKYFKQEYVDPVVKSQPRGKPLSITAPKTVRVNQPVTISGTGTGMISLYSGDHLERELYADKNGEWYIRLYFSVQGEYVLKAKDFYGQTETTLNAMD
ncbi:MAG: hypothetical protein M1285_05600 [Candidatus Thermoplasmatota archaeon]|jgi:hypothetical protein|nr:hypothetical protein [Candidatus Thermoplasmatota archaeon]